MEKLKKKEAEKLEKQVLEEIEREVQTAQPCTGDTTRGEAKVCINIWKRKRPGDTDSH